MITRLDPNFLFLDPNFLFLAAWLASEDKVGACVAVSCINCGRSMFKNLEWLGITVKCYDCQAGPLAKRIAREVASWLFGILVAPVFFLPLLLFEVRSPAIIYVWLVIYVAGAVWLGSRKF